MARDGGTYMAEQSEKSSQAETSSANAPSLSAQIDYVRGLAEVVAEEGLSELEIESDGFKITLKAPSLGAPEGVTPVFAPGFVPGGMMPGGIVPGAISPGAQAPSGAAKPTPKAKASEALTPLVSPMVGVYYRAPSPNDPNFIEVGDRVERGQNIGLIEAMKVFNEITAENSGVVAEILVQNGALVETGQPLVLLK